MRSLLAIAMMASLLLLALILVAQTGIHGSAARANDDCRECETNEVMTESSRDDQHGVLVRETWSIKQTKYDDGATDLHVILWQKEDNIYLNGWRVCISDFDNASSDRCDQPGDWHTTLNNHGCCHETDDPDNGEHAIDVMAWNPTAGTIAKDEKVSVYVCFWLTHENTLRKWNNDWTNSGKATDTTKACPYFGWIIDTPVDLGGGTYGHRIVIFNDDTLQTLRVESCSLRADMTFYDDLESVVCTTAVPGLPLILNPEDSLVFPLETPGSFIGGHVYGKFVLRDPTGSDYEVVNIFDHPVVEPPKGACCVPDSGCVDNLSRVECQALGGRYMGDGTTFDIVDCPTLTQWGLIVLVVLIVFSTWVVLRRRKGIVSRQ